MCEPEFFDYLSTLDASCLTVYTMKEGCLIFPHEPIIRVEGPIAVCQLLETPLLCMVNFASLITTNAAVIVLRWATRLVCPSLVCVVRRVPTVV